MSKFNVRWTSFEARWRGEINHSSLVITKKTLDRKNRYYFINTVTYGVYIIMGVWFLLEIKKSLPSVSSSSFNVSIVVPFVVFLAAVSILQMLVNIYRAPYYKIKALLINRTETEFCDCVSSYWGTSCSKNHKENFMKDVKDTFNLNLYY